MYTYTLYFFFFFFNDTATTEIYTLSLHDALPISRRGVAGQLPVRRHDRREHRVRPAARVAAGDRGSGTHRAQIGRAHVELQSLAYLVCRLLLEKKKKKQIQQLHDKHGLHLSLRVS